MTMSYLAPVPLDGAYRRRPVAVPGRSDTEVEAATDCEIGRPPETKREQIDGERQGSMESGGRTLTGNLLGERDRQPLRPIIELDLPACRTMRLVVFDVVTQTLTDLVCNHQGTRPGAIPVVPLRRTHEVEFDPQ